MAEHVPGRSFARIFLQLIDPAGIRGVHLFVELASKADALVQKQENTVAGHFMHDDSIVIQYAYDLCHVLRSLLLSHADDLVSDLDRTELQQLQMVIAQIGEYQYGRIRRCMFPYIL